MEKNPRGTVDPHNPDRDIVEGTREPVTAVQLFVGEENPYRNDSDSFSSVTSGVPNEIRFEPQKAEGRKKSELPGALFS